MNQKYRILVVDENLSVRKMLTHLLEKLGYETCEAKDGERALRRIRERQPDLVLLDIQMPTLDGIDCLRKIKEENPELGVIMVSGLNHEEDARKTLELGAADYILKPIDYRYLRESVRDTLAIG